MRPPPPGEEGVPQPPKEKKRRRASSPGTLKPKKSRARKLRIDPAALPVDVAQRLQEEDEAAQGDDDCLLIVPEGGSTAALEVSEPAVDESA